MATAYESTCMEISGQARRSCPGGSQLPCASWNVKILFCVGEHGCMVSYKNLPADLCFPVKVKVEIWKSEVPGLWADGE